MNQPLILDGKQLSVQRELSFSKRVTHIKLQKIQPFLATILVGEDPASATYVDMKRRACKRVGVQSKKIILPESTTTEQLLDIISQLNENKKVHGILLQHPVPSQIDERICFNAINFSKDVDGVTSCSFGKMAMEEEAYGSATPQGIMSLLKHYEIPLKGKHAVIIGRSAILGKPMAAMLLNKNATVTICHSHTQNLKKLVLQADIVVAAVGIPRFIPGDWIQKGTVVIDAGYHPQEKCGDVNLEACKYNTSAYTTVPGGVGPMTISTLIEQTILSAEKCINKL